MTVEALPSEAAVGRHHEFVGRDEFQAATDAAGDDVREVRLERAMADHAHGDLLLQRVLVWFKQRKLFEIVLARFDGPHVALQALQVNFHRVRVRLIREHLLHIWVAPAGVYPDLHVIQPLDLPVECIHQKVDEFHREVEGCQVIQVEEPTLHFMARYNPEQKEFINFLVDAFNREVEGLDDVEVWIHTCWGNPNMQKVFTDESYANSMEIYLERLKGDVWTIEACENDFKELPLFKPYRNSLKKKIAVGVISHRTLQADFPDVIASRIHRCLEFIPADKLVLSTDCGFGRQGFNRHLALYKRSEEHTS